MYNIATLTIEELRTLIAGGDDSRRSQIRITDDGQIFLSYVTGMEGLTGIAGRFETFDAGNGYVGPKAATDDEHINRLFAAIQHWKESPRSYIDIW